MTYRITSLSFLLLLILSSLFPLFRYDSSVRHKPVITIQVEEPLFDAWVEFRDKGAISDQKRRRIYRELEKSFNPKALVRRKKRRTFPGLFDERDIPLSKPYLQAVANIGARVMGQSRWMNGTAVKATQRQINRIRQLPCVREVLHQRQRTKAGPRASPPEEIPAKPSPEEENRSGFYGRSRIQVEQLRLNRLHSAGFTGKGVIVAVLDTGFDLSHPAFNHPEHPIRVIYQWDAMDNDNNTATGPQDPPLQHTHGTYALGAIAAYLPEELVGTAYDASFILLKAEDDVEEYFLEEYWFVMALEYAEAHGSDVISSSLTLYTGYDPEHMDGRTSIMARGWEIAAGNGVIGVNGAGNSGHDSDPTTSHLGVPADAFGTLAVGAVLPDGSTARFSSDGPTVDGRIKPELLALGYPVWTVSLSNPNRFTAAAGTSMATPLIAGGVACLLQAHPDWNIEKVFQALFHSGDEFRKNGRPDSQFVRGYGIPDFSLAAQLDKLKKSRMKRSSYSN